jgi:hypothetical protein
METGCTMARKKAMTRADMIALLKSRGTKGRLSKMTKPQLKAMLEKTAPPGDKRTGDEKPPKSDLELEPDDQDGGHFYRKDGTTRSDGKHEHKKNPWPTDKAKASAPAPKPKARKKKLDPIEDEDADITVDLVNRRLNADRHPATGRKISGKKASEMQYILMGNSMSRIMDGDRVAKADIEQRLDNIDKEHKAEFPSNKSKNSDVDVTNVIDEHIKRKRSKPDRLSEQQPDAFVEEREEEDGDQRGKGAGHSYRSWMKKHLKQYGGDMSKAAAGYRKQKGSGMQSKHDQSGKGSGQGDMHGGHYARADGSVSEKEKSKYSGHNHRPARNPVKGDSSDEETVPASPAGRRITRGMNPRDARRARRRAGQGGRGHGDQHGEGIWDDIVGNKGEKYSLSYDMDAIESGAKTVAHSVATSGFGKAVGSAYNSYEGFMDKHPFIHDITDDAAIGIGVAGLTVLTGGLGDAALVGAEGAAETGAEGAAETAAEDGASTAEKDAGKAASSAGDDAGKAADDAGKAADDGDEDLGPEPEPEPLRQSFANPASVGDAGASADANAGKDGVMSGEAEGANKTASGALKDAGKKIGDKVKQEAEEQASTLRDKLKAVGKTAGLAVIGQRGEEATKDADKDEHGDDTGTDTDTDDDSPGGGKGGKGGSPKPPPGYFANQFNEDSFSANSKALQHDGPSRTFGDPWYS